MSTVPEVLAAIHADIRVLAISLITNICVDQYDSGSVDVVGEVLDTLHCRGETLRELVTKTILRLQETRPDQEA